MTQSNPKKELINGKLMVTQEIAYTNGSIVKRIFNPNELPIPTDIIEVRGARPGFALKR